jgi:hypothetical protein
MAYYSTCPRCGCNLDPGEACDCMSIAVKKRMDYMNQFRVESKTGQIVLEFAVNDTGKGRGNQCKNLENLLLV